MRIDEKLPFMKSALPQKQGSKYDIDLNIQVGQTNNHKAEYTERSVCSGCGGCASTTYQDGCTDCCTTCSSC